MNEALLQFIWQQQYFNQQGLQTTLGEPIRILHPGEWNQHQGPDFTNARIQIGSTIWAGQVEIHCNASDWEKHGHSNDPHYANVILHVVISDDFAVLNQNGNPIPTLELENRIPFSLLDRVQQWMDNKEPLVCRNFLPGLTAAQWLNWKTQLLQQRLQRKSQKLLARHAETGGDWNVLLWQLIFECMGGKVNGSYFLLLANSIPLSTLLKKQLSAIEWEAILLGQANLLPVTASAAYHRKLLKEYQYLQYKYQLIPLNKPPAFLRMRPASFPTIRMAQLAGLLLNNPQLFSGMVASVSLQHWKQQCKVAAAEFWDTHYLFNRSSQARKKTLGIQMMYSLATNAILPTLYAYGYYAGNRELMKKVLLLFKEIPGEQNRITSLWDDTGINQSQTFDTQALTELTNNYCTQKKCLHCAVGQQVLKVNLLPDKLHV